MFDDPKKELQRLEEQLLNAELPDDDFDRFYAEIYDEFGTQEPDLDDILDELLAEEAPELMSIHTGAQFRDYREPVAAPQPRKQPRQSQQPQPQPKKKPQQPDGYTDETRQPVPVQKQKVGKGLPILLCLETLGIVGVVAWWILRIL